MITNLLSQYQRPSLTYHHGPKENLVKQVFVVQLPPESLVERELVDQLLIENKNRRYVQNLFRIIVPIEEIHYKMELKQK